MSITGILIVLGCLVAGYWIVSSVMGPGVDQASEGRKEAGRGQASAPAPAPADEPMPDWYIVLDLPPDAVPGEIQAAMRRRLAQAEAAGDARAAARIARAGAAGLRNFNRTPSR
jgi:hypothetical protein